MFDKQLNAPDEVAVIKGLSKNFPKDHNSVNTMYAIGAMFILGRMIRNVFKRP